MDYARTVLDIPVPRVFAWNAHADSTDNPVGAEYILMEKVEGDILHTRWEDAEGKPAEAILDQTIGLEQRFMFFTFSQIGSLYYKQDVDKTLQCRPLYGPEADPTDGDPDKYRIGPLVDWDIWRGTRSSLGISRGPCWSISTFIQNTELIIRFCVWQGQIRCRIYKASSEPNRNGYGNTLSHSTLPLIDGQTAHPRTTLTCLNVFTC